MNLGQWLGLISLIISLYLLWQIKFMLLLLFAAVILATACNNIVVFLSRYGIKRKLAIFLILVTAFFCLAIFLLLIFPPFAAEFKNLAELFPQIWQKIYANFIDLRNQKFDWLPPLPSDSELINNLQPLGTKLFQNFFTFFSNSLGGALQALLVFILTLMILGNPQEYRELLLRLFPSFYRRRADEILSLTEVALVNWLKGIILSSLFIGLLSAAGLLVLQVKLVLAHAVLAAILNLIPNIGPTLSVIFPVMISVIDNPWKIILIVIWYVIVQNIESYVVTPTIMSKQVSLLPAITLLSQIFFATFFGPLGLLLALPLTVVVKTWLSELLFKDILDKWKKPEKPIKTIQLTMVKPGEGNQDK